MSNLYDFYYRLSNLRYANKEEIKRLYRKAREENKELADNAILYTRDIRKGGLGERRAARVMMRELALIDDDKVRRNLKRIVDVGRWDDLFILEGTGVEPDVWNLVKSQLQEDLTNMAENGTVSLLAKWLPSANASSKETRRLAKKICKEIDLAEPIYRKILSLLREYLKIVERDISQKNYNNIEYWEVPIGAIKKYKKAFTRQDKENYTSYIEQNFHYINESSNFLTRINDHLFTYRICEPTSSSGRTNNNRSVIVVPDASWARHYNDDELKSDKCITVSVATALYFAERNGHFGRNNLKNTIMSFGPEPELYKIDFNNGLWNNTNTILSKTKGLVNLDKVLEKVYEMGTNGPGSIVIVSDDEYEGKISREKNLDFIVRIWHERFNNDNLVMPKIIIWNVDGKERFNPKEMYCPEVTFLNGFTPIVVKELIDTIDLGATHAIESILSMPQFCWE